MALASSTSIRASIQAPAGVAQISALFLAAAAQRDIIPDGDGHCEFWRMRRSGRIGHLIGWQIFSPFLSPFLQGGLGILRRIHL